MEAPMSSDNQSTISQAITNALSSLYDKVALDKNVILQSAANTYHLDLLSWEDYQYHAPVIVMDEIANGYILATKIKVSGLGAVCGAGSIFTAIPDVIQFVTLTLRMVTEIAAAYGFDPAPDCMEGRIKCVVLQAYLNGILGQSVIEGVEKIGVNMATKFLKNVVVPEKSDSAPLILVVQPVTQNIGPTPADCTHTSLATPLAPPHRTCTPAKGIYRFHLP